MKLRLTAKIHAADWRDKYVLQVGRFREGLAKIELNGKYGYVDKTGKEVVELKYDYLGDFAYNGLAKAMFNGKVGYVDITGKEVVALKYDSVERFREGLAAVLFNGQWGFVDKTGKEVVKPKYDSVENFHDGLVEAKFNGRQLYVDRQGCEYKGMTKVQALKQIEAVKRRL